MGITLSFYFTSTRLKWQKKPKLTHRQKRQVSTNRSLRLTKTPIEHDNLGTAQPATVVGRFGKHANVEDANGEATQMPYTSHY